MPSVAFLLLLAPLLSLASAAACPKQREQTFSIKNLSWIRNNWSGGAPGNVHREVLQFDVDTEFNDAVIESWTYSHVPAEESTAEPVRYVTADHVGVWDFMSVNEFDIDPQTKLLGERTLGFDFRQFWNCSETEDGPSRAVVATFSVPSSLIDPLVTCVDNPKSDVVKSCSLTTDPLVVTGVAEYV